MDIDCPKCGQRVTLDAHNIIPFHDNVPPLRSVCRGSMDDATAIVAMLATARAEAALAEREACVSDVRLLTIEPDLVLNGNGASLTEQIDAQAILGALNAAVDMIRARTTPATLSTETLAAIAEARGLRVVEPEVLAGLEAVPVLRWGYTAALESEAKVSGWHLTAAPRNWAAIHESGVKVLSPRPNRADERENRRAAEAALRSLGVAFRVEDGGAK